MKNRFLFSTCLIFILFSSHAQKLIPFRLPETGQNTSYTTTFGEDADYVINPMSFTDNSDGTTTDNNTGLMWQKTDGGEMTIESAVSYCKALTLGGYHDWRLPNNIELFSLNKFDANNPAVNTTYFTKTAAEYWWTSQRCIDDTSKVWVVNAGGGTGPHPKTETVSAGGTGTKKFHVRAVRNLFTTTFNVEHFTDKGDGTIKDNFTGLVWQKIQTASTMTWEEALAYAENLSLAGKSDWRMPNIKELQSLNDELLIKPSFNKTYFPNVTAGTNYWSSTTQMMPTPVNAWTINLDYGIVSYTDRTTKQNVLCVRGGMDKSDLNIQEVKIPAGEYMMGDHFGFVDPKHPSDELPLHDVKVNSFYCANTKTTNQQFLAFLNYSLLQGLIEVKDSIVTAKGGSDTYCYLNKYKSYYSISYDGKLFTMTDFRVHHPMVGVKWFGAAAFCNWLSKMNGLNECYNLTTWLCDFTKNGYRLPTEAEWEWAGRGGQINPYYKYPWGDDQDKTKANWPESQDPYEGTSETTYPHTTPVGFYNGQLRLKSEYNWPGSATSYKTGNGVNSFGLYDIAGNVWEMINDWYGQNYYSSSPVDNPKGPDSGFLMPDGKAYRGMRGGNWYNGYKLVTDTVNDGHSRVSNRNPQYYRGPQDPWHPWYHIGFRFVRNYDSTTTSINSVPNQLNDLQVYPNPFRSTATLQFELQKPEYVSIKIYNAFGQLVTVLLNEKMNEGVHNFQWNASNFPGGIYSCMLQINDKLSTKKLILTK